MYFTGIIIAASTFLAIGIWHPIVIKTEYYWGTRPWVIYLIVGLACIAGALFIENAILYQLGIPILLTVDTTVTSHDKSKNHIFIHEGKLYIQTDSALYDAMGRCIKR